jgi:hypothetical protein
LAFNSAGSLNNLAVYDPAGAPDFLSCNVFCSLDKPPEEPKHVVVPRWQNPEELDILLQKFQTGNLPFPFCRTTNRKQSLSQSSDMDISS